jgi:hypothetical protein
VRDRVRPWILSSAAAIAAALVVAATVLAHGGETFFSAEPTIVPPGGGVGVRADLLTSGPVRLTLAGTDGSRREVGVVEETEEGHFEVFFEVPKDLPVGVWTLLAEADDTIYGSTTIEVAGPAVGGEGGGGQGPRDEDDPLLVPLPPGWQASRSSPPGSTTPPEALTNSVDLVPVVSLAAALGALVFLFLRTRGPRSGGDDRPSR